MLGPEVAMAEAARLLERACDDGACRLAEVLRPRERRVDEALVGGLFRDAERRPDLRPRAAVGARGLDVAVEQRVAEPTQLVRRCGCGLDLCERPCLSVGVDRRRKLLECQTDCDGVKVLLTPSPSRLP
jgi:hypothetical protein